MLVLSCDGKGVVMRPQALRPATAKATTSRKLLTRLSKGEQRHRKRLAEVGCVYDCAPIPEPQATSCPHLTSPTHPAAPDHGRGANGWSPASPWTPPG